jgi:hypothetical protein
VPITIAQAASHAAVRFSSSEDVGAVRERERVRADDEARRDAAAHRGVPRLLRGARQHGVFRGEHLFDDALPHASARTENADPCRAAALRHKP